MPLQKYAARLLHAAVLVLVVPGGALRGQGSVGVLNRMAPSTSCAGGVSSASSPSSASIACAWGALTSQGQATASRGRITATSTDQGSAPEPIWSGAGSSSEATASWHEEVRFADGSLIPRYARVSALFSGMLSESRGDARITMSLYGTGAGYGGPGAQYAAKYFDRQPSTVGLDQHDPAPYQPLAVEFTVGSGGFYFEQLLSTQTSAYFVYYPSTATSTWSGAITGLSFYDESHNDVTDQVSYGFRYGTEMVSATPEPATLVLFGSGLIGVLGFAHRKRAA